MPVVRKYLPFCQWGIAGFLLIFAQGEARAFSFPEKSPAFLEHKARLLQFEAQRARFLQERLRQRGVAEGAVQLEELSKGFLRHKAKQRQFERHRKAAFLEYKKQRARRQKQNRAALRQRRSLRATGR